MPAQVRVFVDFDGTVSLEDTTDVILEQFADPAWRQVESEWLSGKIGSRECMARQIDLVRASPEALDALVREVPLDPHFGDFVALCRREDVAITIVSDGLDRAISAMLARAQIKLPILANRLQWQGGDRWQLEFPHRHADCRTAAGNCKCAALPEAPDVVRILVGDGRSDFCAAQTADLVFAKGALTEHCHANGLTYCMFEGFAGATHLLAEWIGALKRRDRVPRTAERSIHAPSTA